MVARQTLGRSALQILATYAAWLISAVLGVGVLITCHSTFLRLYVGFGLDKYAIAFFNNMIVISLGLAWLVGIMILENWYRRAPDLGTLGRRCGRLTLAQVAVAALAYLLGQI
jgi:hypothetical protein